MKLNNRWEIPAPNVTTYPIERSQKAESSSVTTTLDRRVEPAAFTNLSQAYRPNSARSEKYYRLWKVLDNMRRLPEGHEYHLDQAVAAKAIGFLGALNNNFDADLPKILPETSDTIVLTWEKDAVKQFFSIADDYQDWMSLHQINRVRCDTDLSDQFDLAIEQVFKQLSFPTRSGSASTDG